MEEAPLDIQPESTPLPALLDDAKQLGFAELHRRLEAQGHPKIRNAHGCVFRFVEVEGSRLTDLAALSGLTKQAVGEFVDELQGLGYVERVPDPLDGRAKLIRLTERGADARQAAVRIFDEIESEWSERFGEERIAIVRGVLEELATESGLVAAREAVVAAS